MTKRFKKTMNFEAARFMRELEKEVIEEEEGDIFTLTGLERAREADEISDIEEGFISGYMEA